LGTLHAYSINSVPLSTVPSVRWCVQAFPVIYAFCCTAALYLLVVSWPLNKLSYLSLVLTWPRLMRDGGRLYRGEAVDMQTIKLPMRWQRVLP
jgi:hypothetical protein